MTLERRLPSGETMTNAAAHGLGTPSRLQPAYPPKTFSNPRDRRDEEIQSNLPPTHWPFVFWTKRQATPPRAPLE